MASAVVARAERRSSARLRPNSEGLDVVCRIRPGHPAYVRNLSARGALLETRRRLPPGGTIELQWEAEGRRDVSRARVVRCEVAVVLPDSIVYVGAVRFERELGLLSHACQAWSTDL